MGSSESICRITRTDKDASPWVGFCTVVKIDALKDKLEMPNGDSYTYVFENKGLRITEGEHEGFYSVETIY